MEIILAILVGLVLPVTLAIFLKRKFGISLFIFFIGIATFTVTQILLRTPLLQVLDVKTSIFKTGIFSKTAASVFFLSITAGIFEECGRYISFKYILKEEKSFLTPISFGLGHGGIEALIVLIQGVILLITNPTLVGNNLYFSIIERFFSLFLHISLSIIVFVGVKRNIKYSLITAILLHGLVNYIVVYLAIATENIVISEIAMAFITIVYLIISIKLLNRYKNNNEK